MKTKNQYDPVGFFEGEIKVPESAKLGLEFVFIEKDEPDYVDSIDPVVSISEDDDSIYISSLGIWNIIDRTLKKENLLTYELRKFQRDEWRTPRPIGKNLDMSLFGGK